jgi:hypothetical protein
VGRPGDGATEPTIRQVPGGWWWDRSSPSVGGTVYDHGITVHAPSTVTIDLNRACVTYDARAGVDDLVRVARFARTQLEFSVYGDGVRLYGSGPVGAGDPAVPVHVGIAGYATLTLVVEPVGRGLGFANLADWADSTITCT